MLIKDHQQNEIDSDIEYLQKESLWLIVEKYVIWFQEMIFNLLQDLINFFNNYKTYLQVIIYYRNKLHNMFYINLSYI